MINQNFEVGESADVAWRRARTAEFASLLRQNSPLYQQVRAIVEDVLIGPKVTEPLAALLRQLLRELSANLSGQGDPERPLRDFEILLRREALSIIRGGQHVYQTSAGAEAAAAAAEKERVQQTRPGRGAF